jgi:anti-sigma factor (TIGR02949 family)
MTDAGPQVCDQVLERVNLFLDHEMDEAQADAIRCHVAQCETCSDEVDVWALVRHLVKRAYHPDPAPPSLLQRITTQLHAAEARLAVDEGVYEI